MKSSPSVPRYFKPWMGTLFLFFSTLILFWNFLSPSGTQVLSKNGEDLTSQFVWWREFGFDQLKHGHLALWDPKIFCGHPFFGGFQSALLYPPNWLFMVLPLGFALNFSIALHVFLAGFFMYLWILDRGSHPASALMAAFAFMFGGAYFLHVVPGHLPNLCTMPWIPLVFMAVDRFRKNPKAPAILLGMFALSMAIFAGHVQYAYYTILLSGFYALIHLPQAKNKRSYITGLFFFYGGAVFLTAMQLVAGWDAVKESVRTQVTDIDFLNMSAMTPERFWTWLVPNFYGGLRDYWGGGLYWEGAVFVSMVVFLLAIFTLKNVQHPQKKLFGWMLLFLVVLSLGKATPLFLLLVKYLPLFGSFRGISKINILMTLCLAVLASMGFDALLAKPELFKKLKSWAFWIAGLTAFVGIVFAIAPHVGGGRLFGKFLTHAGFMTENLFFSALVWAVIGFLCILAFHKPLWRYAFVVVAFIELFCFAWLNRPSFNLAELQKKVAVIDENQQKHPGDYRVFTEVWDYPLGTSALGVRGEDPTAPSRFELLLSRIPQLLHYYHNLNAPIAPCLAPAALTRLQYVFYEKDGKLVPQKVNIKPVARASFYDRFEVLPKEKVLDRVFDPHFDLRKTVCLESEPAILPQPGPPGQVQLQDLNTDEVMVTVKVSHPTLLVLSDTYSRQLKTEDQRKPTTLFQILPADSFETAIPLQAGEHQFLIAYRPDGFEAAKWVTILSWGLFIVYFFATVLL